MALLVIRNGVISLVIMFTPGVMVIKISKMAHFYAKHLSALERSF